MTLLDRFRRWRRSRQRQRSIAISGRSPLREFVYLDEVSVYSLVSSLTGALAAEITVTESTSLTGEVTAKGDVKAFVAKGEVEGRTEAARQRDTQVLRKSNIQATFRELYQHTEDRLGLIARGAAESPELHDDVETLEAALERLCAQGWATAASALERGMLLELDVELRAEGVYQVSTVMSSFLEIVKEAPELSGGVRDELQNGSFLNMLLDKLLVGLVPVRGRAADVCVVTSRGNAWVVHKKAIRQIQQRWAPEISDLEMVALTEASLFWRDLRRVLFSNARYTVFARLGRGGLHYDWAPVKLVDVIRGVAPEVASQLDAAGQVLQQPFQPNPPSTDQNGATADLARAALGHFGRALCAHYGRAWDERLLEEVLLDDKLLDDWTTLAGRRQVFDKLLDQMRAVNPTIDPDRPLVASLRDEALSAAEMPNTNSSNSAAARQVEPGGSPRLPLLDVEVIAIYW